MRKVKLQGKTVTRMYMSNVYINHKPATVYTLFLFAAAVFYILTQISIQTNNEVTTNMRSHPTLMRVAALMVCVGSLAIAQSTPKPDDVLSAISRANAYYMSNATLQSDDCNWTQATYFDGATALISATQDPAALAFVSKWAESHYFTCDRGNAKWDWHADRQACGHAFAELHSLAPADRKLALAVTLSKQISASTSV